MGGVEIDPFFNANTPQELDRAAGAGGQAPGEHEPPAAPPIIGIAGWKKSGKTTLATRLIAEFTRRGLKVATVKHAHHAFQIDDAETDSARHRRAGAAQVAIVSRERWALIRELQSAPEPDLTEVISWLGPCDLVIVEGYKRSPIPKIEVRRRAASSQQPLAGELQRHRHRRRSCRDRFERPSSPSTRSLPSPTSLPRDLLTEAATAYDAPAK